MEQILKVKNSDFYPNKTDYFFAELLLKEMTVARLHEMLINKISSVISFQMQKYRLWNNVSLQVHRK